MLAAGFRQVEDRLRNIARRRDLFDELQLQQFGEEFARHRGWPLEAHGRRVQRLQVHRLEFEVISLSTSRCMIPNELEVFDGHLANNVVGRICHSFVFSAKELNGDISDSVVQERDRVRDARPMRPCDVELMRERAS